MANRDSTTPVYSASPAGSKRIRWRLQFGLRTFVVLTLLLGAGIGMLARHILRANRQRELVDLLIAKGFDVQYDDGTWMEPRLHRHTSWPSLWMDVDLWRNVVSLQSQELHSLGLDTLRCIAELPELEKLEIEFSHPGQSFPIPSLACRKRLQQLKILHYPLRPADIGRVAECRSLKSLELYVDEASNVELAAINGLKQLQTLRIHGPLDEDAVAAWEHFPHLEELYLDGARPLSSETLADTIRRHPALRRVELVNVECTMELCEAIRACQGLTHLRLANCDLDDEGLAVFRELPQLTKLDIRGTGVRGEAFDGIGSFAALVELSARDSQIDDRGASFIGKLPQLRTLDLTQTRITDAACEPLSRTRLVRLALSTTEVRDRGIATLHCEHLEELYLDGTGVTPRAFFTASQWPKLKVLYLSNRKESEADLERVLQIPTLTTFYASAPTKDDFQWRYNKRFTSMPSLERQEEEAASQP